MTAKKKREPNALTALHVRIPAWLSYAIKEEAFHEEGSIQSVITDQLTKRYPGKAKEHARPKPTTV